MAAVQWFRRDLRLSDNPALNDAIESAASERGGVVGLFVVDPRLWSSSGTPRLDYVHSSLRALDAELDGRLVVRVGDPETVVPQVAREAGATCVHVAESFEPYGRRRDAAVARRLQEVGIAMRAIGSPYAVSPGRVVTQAGSPYRVFTAFYRAWLRHGWRQPAPRPRAVPWLALPTQEVPGGGEPLEPVGEAAATARWVRFLADIDAYDSDRDRPDLDATSRLSAAVKWGELHPRTLLADLAAHPGQGASSFARQLAWREFHADVLAHQPEAARQSILPVMPADFWTPDPVAEIWFTAWAQGRTGYPMVDAGMRQLLAEGWMHGRARMIVGSFLVKDLHIPWQRGAAHFMRHLLDAEIAQNQLNWQWIAGTGLDAAPYFRIFNPVTQGTTFDPDGDYVRRWVPELREIPGRAVHEPWRLTRPPTGYPTRIVDHGTQRALALAGYARGRAQRAGDSSPPR